MDELQTLISKYRSDPTSYSPEQFRRNLASWGPLLFYHLDAEVETLKPEILRRCMYSLSKSPWNLKLMPILQTGQSKKCADYRCSVTSNHPSERPSFLRTELRALAELCVDPRSFDDSLKRLINCAEMRVSWPRLGSSDKEPLSEVLQDVVVKEKNLDEVFRFENSDRLECAGE